MNAPPFFGRCECAHPIYDHARRTLPSSGGILEHTACRVSGCPCERFKASDGSAWPLGPAAVQAMEGSELAS